MLNVQVTKRKKKTKQLHRTHVDFVPEQIHEEFPWRSLHGLFKLEWH